MSKNSEKHMVLAQGTSKGNNKEEELRRSLFSSKPPKENKGRPSSMVIKKTHRVIPAHIVAEAISTLHGLDLRWSGPITPAEMQYVEQYVLAKYPEYSNALVEGGEKTDLYNLCVEENLIEAPQLFDEMRKSPRSVGSMPFSGSSSSSFLPDIENSHLEPSRLLNVLTKKSSFLGSFISIPEIQARNKVLKHCGLSIIGQDEDYVREFAGYKGSRVIVAPESWLDLRIKGSQLSHYFRRKCKHSPKGLFSYPMEVDGTKYSMHWISEAHRNSWHVLLDATALIVGEDQKLSLALHRPDFVLCSVENTTHYSDRSSKVTCLLVRRKSFDMSSSSAQALFESSV